ncbi:MAG: YqhA family protein [Prevotellaceae bacterium]|nr:YqhA family protein [Prevotellaceae bacterium]
MLNLQSVDGYLFATVLLIFSMGIYELFINKIDVVRKRKDSRPNWLVINSIDDLKSSLGKVILMILIVSFFEHSLNIKYENISDLLFLGIGILLISAALFLTHAHRKHKNE